LSEIEDLLHEVEIISLRFVDSSQAGGELQYPLNHSIVDALMAQDGATIIGFTASHIRGEARKVRRLLDSEDVFLVEAGAREYLEEFPDAQIVPLYDVAYEYTTYVGPVCTIDALRALLITKHDSGLIDDPGIFNSFLVKLDEVSAKIAEGQNEVARNILGAFINEGHAQAGKHVEKTAAGELIIVAECVRYSLR